MSALDVRNRGVQRRQWLLFSVLAGVVSILAVLWLGAGGGDGAPALRGIEAQLAVPGEAEAGWVRQSETRLGGIELRLREIEAANRGLEAENLRLQRRLREDAEDARAAIDRQAALIEEMTQGIGAAPGNDPFTAPAPARPEAQRRDEPNRGNGAAESIAAPVVREFELERRPGGGPDAESSEPIPVPKPTADYVPAGSYAEAVVIAGADASASVQSQGDPRPVLLRLTSPAFGAAVDGIASRSDVEGCTVTGAAYGDLSSEKVYVRLQTMACAGDAPGTVIETPVSGFVAGGGQAGVRGAVVSREGALVQRAFMAGLFSGFGESANQAFRPQAVIGGGAAALTNTDFGDIGRAGLGTGAGTAGREIGDYLIRRAEQYQPVIQLSAGTPVTVVFLEGTWLDGREPVAMENG